MSTRANIIIQDHVKWSDDGGPHERIQRLYFYRHSDGYPEGVAPTLNKFVGWLKAGKIRANVSQGSGWLIMLGIIEYDTIPVYGKDELLPGHSYGDIELIEDPKDWKVGAYEPTTGIHGDIQHLYLIDLNNKEWREIPETEWEQYKPNK